MERNRDEYLGLMRSMEGEMGEEMCVEREGGGGPGWGCQRPR